MFLILATADWIRCYVWYAFLRQVAGRLRWHRLRRDWLRAVVCINDCAVVAVDPIIRPGSTACDVSHRCTVWTMLSDYRILAHDDSEGRPLRYMSLYGGIVTKML